MNRKKQDKKNTSCDQEYLPVKGKKHPCRSSHSLPSFKMKIKWKIVAKHTACCCVHPQQRKYILITVLKQMIYKNDSQHTLKHISQQSDGSCLFAQCTQSIGGACIAAAALANINMMGFSYQVAGLKHAEYIADPQTN